MTDAKPSSLPTMLTLARIAAGPIVAALVLWAAHMRFIDPPRAALIYGWASALFVLAALTDWLDGWLARKLKATSPLGAALDHCADKVLVTTTLLALAYAALPVDLVIAAILIIGRDVAIAGLREGLSNAGRTLPVSALGKWKTVAELTGVGALLALQSAALGGAPYTLILSLSWLGAGLLWIAVTLALFSAAAYVGAALSPNGADQPNPAAKPQSQGETTD